MNQTEWEALVRKCETCGKDFKPSEGYFTIAPNKCFDCGEKVSKSIVATIGDVIVRASIVMPKCKICGCYTAESNLSATGICKNHKL